LAVCKAIIEAHQGTVMAANRSPRGACIHFTLPLGEPPIFNEALLIEELT